MGGRPAPRYQASVSGLRFFFFNDPATTEIYTLSLHDALPIYRKPASPDERRRSRKQVCQAVCPATDRKSTRLNSSHHRISYAVFCLTKNISQLQADITQLNASLQSASYKITQRA